MKLVDIFVQEGEITMVAKPKKLTSTEIVEDSNRTAVLKELQCIPGVGKSIAVDLWDLGFRAVDQLREQDAEELYVRLCVQQGAHVDRCMLYVLRCAIYYASQEQHEAELLKWWNWKDK